MAVAETSEFWSRLARCINGELRVSRDNNIRFLWVDDFGPGTVLPKLDQDLVLASAFVSEDSGKSFVPYRVTLNLSTSAAEAFRKGEWSRLLPHQDSSGWLTISRTNKEIEIKCA
jgi:hypothetical protein